MISTHRVALFTGGSCGIGCAIALRLAKAGFNIVVNYQSNAAKAQEIVSQIATLPSLQFEKPDDHHRATPVQGDVVKIPDGERLLEKTIYAFGRLDVIVFSTTWVNTESIRELAEQLFTDAFDINVKCLCSLPRWPSQIFSRLRVRQLVQSGVRRARGSRAISISSVLATTSITHDSFLLYCMSKGAPDDLKPKALEGTHRLLDLSTQMLLEQQSQAILDAQIALQPHRHPEDVADVISFLPSGESGWVNGQTIGVSGGSVV